MRRFLKQHSWAVSSVLLLLVAMGFVGVSCDDFIEHVIFGSRGTSALQRFYAKHTRDWTIRFSADRRRVTSLIGKGTRPYAGEPQQKAELFLRETADLFGLVSDLSDLRARNIRADAFSANVEYQQVFKGLPVENGRLQVNFDKDGRVLQVVSSYAPPDQSVDKVTLTKEQASSKATEEFLRATPIYTSKVAAQNQSRSVINGKIEGLKSAKVDDVYFIRDDRLHRAYKTLINAARPFGVKELIVDANTGELLQIRDFVYGAVEAHAQVFIPNPVNTLRDNTISDGSTFEPLAGDGSSSNSPYRKVTLLGLETPAEGPFTLKGPYVVIEALEGNTIEPARSETPDGFNFARNLSGFEDVMVYYHIDRMQRYIQEKLLFTDVANYRISADAHAFGEDNSLYVSSYRTPGQGYLLFGTGGIDDAEDADVIAHEYGHAIQDNQTGGKYSGTRRETRAMGEGFGDYWAVSSSWQDTQQNGSDQACVMEWDGVPGCVRRVDLNVTFNPSASDYDNGQVWSKMLFDIFNKFGKEIADKLILQSHFNVPDQPTFVQGAEAILVADEQRFGSSHKDDLCQIFQARRIDGVGRCSTPSH